MSIISLRMYIREIESIIDQGRMDEAIAHCKQVLSKFPKHIETYRLLGKTFLENNQNSNAADIFQRVLSAIPDDFVSHVGMSLIREEEGNIISAVEHMERAFEKQPYNNAIQEELRRLYGKRDGIEPPKVRLTQGALARIYLRGDHTNQGIAELRSAIAENPDRYDLKTLLVEAYAQADQMAKAIDLASDILKKYPYNITANRILANTLRTHDHPQEMAICKKRLFALSPYEAYISEHAPTLDQVPDRAITLDKIDWDEFEQSLRSGTREGIPPWSNSPDNEQKNNSISGETPIPDWLANGSQEEGKPMSEDKSLNSISNDPNQDGSPNNPEQSESIPEWMKDAGWDISDGSVDESKPAFEDIEELEEFTGDDEIVPAEIPEWLEEAAPSTLMDEIANEEEIEPSIEPKDDDFLDYEETSREEETSDYERERDEPFQELESPDWEEPADEIAAENFLDEIEDPEIEEDTGDIPAWLKDLQLDEDSQETAVAWLENMPEDLFSEEDDQGSMAPESFDDHPSQAAGDPPLDEREWIEDLYSTEEKAEASRSEELAASNLIPEDDEEPLIYQDEELSLSDQELPTWLDELGSAEEEPDQVMETDDPTQKDLPEQTRMGESEGIDPVPDWLSDFESEVSPDASQRVEAQDVADEGISETNLESDLEKEQEIDIPDWMGSEDQVDSEQTPDFSTGEGSLAWLESLSADESPLSPDDHLEVSDLGVDEAAELSPFPEDKSFVAEEVSQDKGDDELPNWLSNFDDDVIDDGDELAEFEKEPQQQSQPGFTEDAQPEIAPDDETLSTEIPDWLAGLSDQEQQPDPQVDTGDAVGEDETVQETPDWFDQIEEKPEADEQLVEPSEIISDEFDDPEPSDPKDTEAIPDEDVEDMPDWLSELDLPEESESLMDAIQKEDRPLTDEEKAFLEQRDDHEVSEWLAALEKSANAEAASEDIHATKPDDERSEMSGSELDESADGKAQTLDEEGLSNASGMLERLRSSDQPSAPEPTQTPELKVPQWLEDLKKEEDPQETAILWLQEFVKSGRQANLQEEIKRFTDELDPGDSIPTWMENLQKEEDPQTTAMLWLEKLETERDEVSVEQVDSDESGWLAELEQEEIELEKETQAREPSRDDFFDDDADWLSDLDTDPTSQSALGEDSDPPTSTNGETDESGDTPPWMKATSPLEGDVYTNELDGGSQEDVEIPEWLAGYTDEELQLRQEAEDVDSMLEGDFVEEESRQPEEAPVGQDEEYGWFTTDSETSEPSQQRMDLNQAAISQLESIIGISYKVAKGIVSYREKYGPYQSLEDLRNVPEITDEQTIEILKPEIFISPEDPQPTKTDAQQDDLLDESFDDQFLITEDKLSSQADIKSAQGPADTEQMESDQLKQARHLIKDGAIEKALSIYGALLDDKNQVKVVINDLEQATLEYPVDVLIMKTLGDAYMKKDMLQEALDAYSKAEDLLR